MTNPAHALSPVRKLTGFHVLAILLGFFFTVTGVNVLMMYSAISTFGGLETQDAYRKGLAYNETIAQEEAQSKLGWSATVKASPARETLVVELLDRTAQAIPGLAITGEIGRAATNQFDKPLTFRETAPGRYEASLGAALEAGTWLAHLRAVKAKSEGPDTVFEARHRIWIAP